MERIRFLIGILFLIIFSGIVQAAEAPRIDKDAAKNFIGKPNTFIIDVRAASDWLLTKEKIKGAIRENPRDFDTWVKKYPKESTIILYCA
jgi:rhodanese-related sulfurtransferase